MNIKTVFTALFISALLSAPMAAYAASVRVDDTVAGISTTLTINEVEAEKVTVEITPPFGSPETLVLELDDEGNGDMLIPARILEQSGEYDIYLTAEDDADFELDTTLEVFPDELDPFTSSIQVNRAQINADGSDATEVTVILRDKFGNPVQGMIQLISSRGDDMVEPYENETNEHGEQHFAVSTYTPGPFTLRAMDMITGELVGMDVTLQAAGNNFDAFSAMGGPGAQYQGPQYASSAPRPAPVANGRQLYRPQRNAGSNLGASVLGRNLYGQLNDFGYIDSFIIEAPVEMDVNLDEDLTITAVDELGRVVEDYVGTALLSSSDPNATLPSFGEVMFRASDLGRKKLRLALRFTLPGEQIIYAEDSSDPSISGQAVSFVSGGDGHTSAPEILVDAARYTSDSDFSFSVTGNAYTNYIVTTPEGNYFFSTDELGKATTTINLGSEDGEKKLQVLQEMGSARSEEFTVVLDTEKPSANFKFSPTDIRENDDVLVQAFDVTDGDSGIASVTLTIGEQTWDMSQSDEEDSYQRVVSIDAAGEYEAIATLIDNAGNEVEYRYPLTVALKGLAPVTGLAATVETGKAILTWDALDDADNYEVLVGTSPGTYDFSLQTGRATTTATVSGLGNGQTYYFVVYGQKGERSSDDPSNEAVVTIAGINLEVIEKKGSVQLKWAGLETQPIAKYALNYGTDPDDKRERRLIEANSTPGGEQMYTLKDLLDGVTYYFALTPIAVNGEQLTDLMAYAEGTPNGNGSFTVGPANPIPGTLHSSAGEPSDPVPPITNLHTGAPQQPMTGLPHGAWWALLGAITGVSLFMWHKRRQRKHWQEFMNSVGY